jgi:hypothetical protein
MHVGKFWILPSGKKNEQKKCNPHKIQSELSGNHFFLLFFFDPSVSKRKELQVLKMKF